MQSFLNSIQSVAIILVLTATGYICGAKGWFKPDAKAFISKFLLTFAVPFTCIYSLRSRLTLEMLSQSAPLLLVPFISISLNFLLAFAVGKVMKLPRRTFGPFLMMCGLSNTLFIGFPMCTELFGDECIIYVITFYMVSTCFTQGVGNTLVMWAGESGNKQSPGKFALKLAKTPPIIGVVVGLIIVIINFNPPQLVMTYAHYMNNLVTPLALLIAGKIIHEIGLKNLKFDRVIVLVLLFRFVISPAICYLFCNLFGITGLARSVYVVQAAMPIVTQTVVSSAEYGADEATAARGAAMTTIAMFLVIPILMLFLG